ncbi:nuclear transport factor 2 family protein [Ekhidna sp.]|uniref:nuclear transport factor 2 family protein n=1 Tax=Ekhidna sp. TaxID=2608089 RepID=UPI00329A04D8
MKTRINLSLLVTMFGLMALCQSPEELANAQLEAYNNRDIEAFLKPYSDSVKVYNGKREMLYQGKETMKSQYGAMFDRTPNLNCKLLNRIAVGNTVIEHEEVVFGEGRKIYAIVMYKVGFNKIQEVHFLDRVQ